MRKILLTSLILGLTIPTASADARKPRLSANPSAIVAAELAFAQLAQDKGQWTAFRATAADGAEMFVPLRVKAHDWLKGRANPLVAVKWQPHEVWSSCDGSYAVTQGTWQRPDSIGYFTTVWQRQKDGSYKWILDHGDTVKEAEFPPEMIAAKVADCTPVTSGVASATASLDGSPVDEKTASSRDGSLEWTSVVLADGARNFSVRLWLDGEMRDVLINEVSAPGT